MFVIADPARWIEQQQWQFFSGTIYRLNSQMIYSRADDFKSLSVTLTKNAIDYADRNRDEREMNTFELYR